MRWQRTRTTRTAAKMNIFQLRRRRRDGGTWEGKLSPLNLPRPAYLIQQHAAISHALISDAPSATKPADDVRPPSISILTNLKVRSVRSNRHTHSNHRIQASTGFLLIIIHIYTHYSQKFGHTCFFFIFFTSYTVDTYRRHQIYEQDWQKKNKSNTALNPIFCLFHVADVVLHSFDALSDNLQCK